MNQRCTDLAAHVFLPLLVVCGACLLVAAQSQEAGRKEHVSPSMEEVLQWLPPDSETLFVGNGPFKLPVFAKEEQPPRQAPLEEWLEEFSLGPLEILGKDAMQKLEGKEVAISVFGSRSFQPPTGRGSSRYEGAHVLVFRRALTEDSRPLRDALTAAAMKTRNIGGQDVFCFENKYEKDVWRDFVALPSSNVLICATDEGYLEEVLKRMRMRRPATPRAFPPDLPKWKYVNREARFWAIRHYRAKPSHAMEVGALEPDGQGLVFIHHLASKSGEKGTTKLTYLSAAKDALQSAREATLEDFELRCHLKLTSRQIAPGVIEIIPELTNDEAGESFYRILTALLGHAVCI